MTRVLVVDDQALIRQAVSDILGQEPGIDVVGEARNGREAVALVATLRPDVVLMDIRMPELDGIEATAAICGDPRNTEVRVLILTTFEEDEYLLAALRAGASGFIGKGAEPDDIVRAVRAVHAGDALLSPAATRSLITRYVLRSQPTGPSIVPEQLEQLTDREREVLLLVARGHANAEIAELLFISPHTAKTHVNRIMAKVHAHDRAQLVIIAYESGLLSPGGH
ncbi:DNA-binding response regulator [Pseudoclavibacter sp. RFBJ3]|uniref:response regulator transcription factor n=1 Tax=unclassified Pseudoclavibacter TaxID=2615177 RepID=UPI000CE90C21|nr:MULTISPECIES: response regulator transcription factor [unclassified Pseudoclavibacter]PPF83709.1 DNA-binding response regulator [Pseudoclavibacter sp. RFBJ5]PPF91989.1 DNA-binding response regulator [Pseudoclavibacter sp. RFBJ3]PPF96852.1 DNA-binding response regulator [Pseudoclavibacter sp. RFBH5]PPG23538.1 DNA-binding response regulator [Pseudoclavibacter sp. RFBI4]